MATIIDLDALLGEDKKVKVGGKTYTLPPDLPVELYLRINRFAATDASDQEMVEALYEELLDLFRYKDPKLQKLPLTMAQLVGAIAKIYGDETDAEDDAARPPRTRGGASTRSRATKRSQQ